MILGAMKSGTSTLFHLLAQHPEICGSKPKEPEFFSNQINRTEVVDYNDLWSFDPGIHTVKLEASTGYTKWPMQQGVPEKIYAAGLSPRFIYIVRDPVARIRSHWTQARRLRWPGIKPPHADPFIGFQDERLMDVSRYHLQLERFRRIFPERERYLILDFFRLSDPQGLAKECFEFLGLKPDFEIENITSQNAKLKLTEMEARLVYSGIQKSGYWLPYPLKKAFRQCLRRIAPDVKTDLTDSQIEILRNKLRPDIEAFARDYRFDISPWGF